MTYYLVSYATVTQLTGHTEYGMATVQGPIPDWWAAMTKARTPPVVLAVQPLSREEYEAWVAVMK